MESILSTTILAKMLDRQINFSLSLSITPTSPSRATTTPPPPRLLPPLTIITNIINNNWNQKDLISGKWEKRKKWFKFWIFVKIIY
jgi:hypothetical protein